MAQLLGALLEESRGEPRHDSGDRLLPGVGSVLRRPVVATQRETFPPGTQLSAPGPLASAFGDPSGTAAVGLLGESSGALGEARHQASPPQRWKASERMDSVVAYYPRGLESED